MQKDKIIKLICDFLKDIGIEIIESKIENKTFLPGLEIQQGRLIFERDLLLYPGDLLHEAGHIAVRPGNERFAMQNNITESNPDKAGEEIAVLLWSYAAAKAIGIEPAMVFHTNGYKGESEWILHNFNSSNYVGLPLLVWMGLTSDGKEGFPKMLKWLRE